MSAVDRLLLAAPRQLVDQIAMAIAAVVLLLGALLIVWLAVRIGRRPDDDSAAFAGEASEE